MYRDSFENIISAYVTITVAMYQYPYLLWYNWYKEMSKERKTY